jgi:hypothetical protein
VASNARLLKRYRSVMLKSMKQRCVILAVVLACSLSTPAQERGAWRATSNTATSITGDVALGDTRIAINFSSFTMVRIRELAAGEVSAAFDADSNIGVHGNLYRLSIPATKTFLHKNTLCGSEDTQWMAAYVGGNALHLAFFSGTKMPLFTPEAFANSTDLCGTFLYTR